MKKLLYLAFLPLMLLVATLSSCSSDDDDNGSYGNMEMKVGEMKNLGTGVDWTSSMKYVASVEDGILKAHIQGETTISGSGNSFRVKVIATRNDFDEPYIGFGSSASVVKDANSKYTLLDESSTSIGYKGTGKVVMYIYSMKNSTLAASAMCVDADDYGDDVLDFLKERYVPATYDKTENIAYLVTPDKKMAVLVGVKVINYIPFYMVMYAPLGSETQVNSKLDSNLYFDVSKSDKAKAMVKGLFEKFEIR